MNTRSHGTPQFGLLCYHRRRHPRGSEIENYPNYQSPVRENPLFETQSESSSTEAESDASSMAEENLNGNEPPVERFGDIFRSGATHPEDFAYAMDNVSIPPHFISLINGGNLFHGKEVEDPISHLNAFYELTINHRPLGVPHDRIKRALFPFSLRDKAREWYDSLPGYNVATFEELKSKFLMEYNSPMKIERLRDAITSFRQEGDETFAEALKRFSEMLRKCPSHGLALGRELIKLYQGLSNESMGLINASTSGDLNNKTYDEVRALFQRLADNQRNWFNPRKEVEKKGVTFGAAVE